MQNIWELEKERLITEEIKNELLLRTDHEGKNAWHITAYRVELYILQHIWVLARERQTTQEIKMKYYYAQTVREKCLARCSI